MLQSGMNRFVLVAKSIKNNKQRKKIETKNITIMKHIFSITKVFLMALCIGWGLLATSCINEDLDACQRYSLTLRVLNLDGDDITVGSSEDVEHASVFVFDENGKYLEKIKMTSAQITSETPIQVNYPATAKLQIVAWGNVDNDRQELQVGSTIEDLKVQIAKSGNYAQSPDSLFYGKKDISLDQGTLIKNEELPIQLAVGRLQMRTLNLQAGIAKIAQQSGLRADDVNCQFYFDRTLDQLNASCEVEGENATYNPDAEWVGGEWEMTDYALIFPGELQLGVFEASGSISIEKDEDTDYVDKTKLRAAAGHDTIVVFVWGDDGEYLGARVKVRPWGYVEDDIEW